jgi:hypothetical protein
MSIDRVWKPSARSSSSRRSRKAGQRKPLAASSRCLGRRYLVFDVDATRQAARQRALPCDPTLPAAKRRRGCGLCSWLPRTQARGGGAHAHHSAQRCTRENLVGTYAGKGNGDYRGELASARRPITAYLKYFAFPAEMALIRLDGAGCAMRPSSLNCSWPTPLAFRAGEAICSWSIPRSSACWLMHRRRAWRG